MKLTQRRLKSLLKYDPKTGYFFWKSTGYGRRINQPAGVVHNTVRRIHVDKKLYPAQDLAWLYMSGKWPEGKIRFKNGIRSDCSANNIYQSKIVRIL